jgi:hypothetical protein
VIPFEINAANEHRKLRAQVKDLLDRKMVAQRHFEEIGAALTRAGNLHVTEAGSAAGS